MIFYFLKRFYTYLFGFFCVVISILSLGDLLVRLALLPSLAAIPIIFMLMFPLMAVFALPLATSFGTHVLVGSLCDANEIVVVHYLSRLKNALFKATLIFSLSIMIIYIPLVFEWAPTTYFRGKKYMVMLAKERLLQLEAGKFHTFFSKVTLYFQDKKSSPGETFFTNCIIKTEMNGRPVIVIARRGIFQGDSIKLEDGMFLSSDQQKNYSALYGEMHIEIASFWDAQKGDALLGAKDSKHMDMSEVLHGLQDGNHAAFVEFHVRVARIVWQFIFPFIAIMIMLSLCSVGGNNLLLSLSSSLFLMLISYVALGVAQSLHAYEPLFLIVTYGEIVLVLLMVLYIYRRKKI